MWDDSVFITCSMDSHVYAIMSLPHFACLCLQQQRVHHLFCEIMIEFVTTSTLQHHHVCVGACYLRYAPSTKSDGVTHVNSTTKERFHIQECLCVMRACVDWFWVCWI